MSNNWFKDWFNSDYYHILYKNRNMIEASKFIDKLCSTLKIKKGKKILDLACGKGRHTIHLAKKGYLTTGVDLSEVSINKAKKNSIYGANFEIHDMRYTYKKNEFDYVLNLFTSFGYFIEKEENIKVLKSAALNLNNNGLLIIDFFNIKKLIHQLITQEYKKIDCIDFYIKRSYNGKYIIKNINIIDNSVKLNFQEKVYAFNLNDFKEITYNLGLEIIKTYGSYEFNNFNENESERLILLIKKIKS